LSIHHNIGDIDIEQSVLTVGSFDGVHCGHRVLLQRVIDLAKENGCRSLVVTFWPHPRTVLDTNGTTSLLLNTLDEKIELLTRTGIDDVLVLPFDMHLAQMSASGFIEEIIAGKLKARVLVVGEDHHFGKGRSGNASSLSAMKMNDMKIEVVKLKKLDQKISSSFIRKSLLSGDLPLANKMLGYDYRISGKVIHGNQLGRTIGFPTANIEVPGYKLLPKDGVYRVEVRPDRSRSLPYLGMMYIGKRPVLKEKDTLRHIEVNIFDFNEQIYGTDIVLSLTHRIRDDINFNNIHQLAQQLNQDKQTILNI
jgi:riboflavin kinase/FMN adenylyltransferase